MNTVEFGMNLLVGWGAAIAIAAAIASLADAAVKDEAKREIAKRIESVSILSGFEVAHSYFKNVSDAFYGQNIFSVKAIAKSSLVTLVWAISLLILSAFIFPNYFDWPINRPVSDSIYTNMLIVALSVIIIDFISVSVTRLLIRHSSSSMRWLTLVIVVDFVLSVLIFYVGYTLIKFMFVGGPWADPETEIKSWTNLGVFNVTTSSTTITTISSSGTEVQTGDVFTVFIFPESILFYSSLLTSTWLWIYILSFLFYSILRKSGGPAKLITDRMDFNKSPFSAMSLMIVILYPALGLPLFIVYVISKALFA